ncbi:helix-turn-helix domain-containing protein [Thalassovita sp.]|uniref:helix-turn-helix domain-containing protein n=1 Tax=Thalassovita sp. TaxID=1979401 RepID=UPI003B59E527
MTAHERSFEHSPGRANVEKLVEYRTAHYSAHSEAASYLTNTPARVQFRFSNPIVCRLTQGHKVMSVGGSKAFGFDPGHVMYVPPGMEIDIDLGAATPDQPIECDCFEIEAGRMDSIIARLNENLSSRDEDISATIDWGKFAVLSGADADDLRLDALMQLFRGDRAIFSDMRIETRIDDTILSLLQARTRDLVSFERAGAADTGLMAAARIIRENLDRHLTNEDLAKIACMSESTLHRKFKKHFGTSPLRFANQLRIARAKRELRQHQNGIEAMASQLGFSDASHFSRVFRSSVGETPAEYRRRRQTQLSLREWEFHSSN